jgi:hypothetical protein
VRQILRKELCDRRSRGLILESDNRAGIAVQMRISD